MIRKKTRKKGADRRSRCRPLRRVSLPQALYRSALRSRNPLARTTPHNRRKSEARHPGRLQLVRHARICREHPRDVEGSRGTVCQTPHPPSAVLLLGPRVGPRTHPLSSSVRWHPACHRQGLGTGRGLLLLLRALDGVWVQEFRLWWPDVGFVRGIVRILVGIVPGPIPTATATIAASANHRLLELVHKLAAPWAVYCAPCKHWCRRRRPYAYSGSS